MTMRFLAAMPVAIALSGCLSLGGLGGAKTAPDPGVKSCVENARGKIIEIDSPNGKLKTCKMPDGRLVKLTELLPD